MIAAIVVLAVVALVLAALIAYGLRLALAFIADERAHMRLERESWTLERAILLQRIQAPEHAVVEHAAAQPFEKPPVVAMDDDLAQWAAVGVEVPKEDLAEAVYQ